MTQFREIYEEYGEAVYRFLLSLTMDSDLASELLQETFYRALINIDGFEGRSSLLTWLCEIGKNAYFKECKRRKRFYRLSADDLNKTVFESPEELVIKSDDCKRVIDVLHRLDEPYRGVFTLRIFGEQSFYNIGGVYGKSENWARVTYFRAKEKILSEL